MTPEEQKEAVAIIRKMANLLILVQESHPLSSSVKQAIADADRIVGKSASAHE